MESRTRGATSVMFTVFIQSNTSTTGAGLTGLTSASTNLQIGMRRELSSTVTVYTGANIEAQTTIGTYQAPSSSSKIRFKAVDGTNQPGVYEIQVHDSATNGFGTGDASVYVDIYVFEITTSALLIAPSAKKILLEAVNRQSATAFITGVNSLAPPASWNTDVVQTGDSYARIGAAGVSLSAIPDLAGVTTLLSRIPGTVQAQTGDAYARLGAPAGASVSADVAAVKVDTAAVKLQTDKLAFTVTNQVDSNVLDWKSATAPAMTGDAFARLGAPAGASVSADIAGVQSDTNDIQTRIPAALVSGRMDASVGAMAADTLTAAALATDAVTEIQGGLSTLDAAGVRTAVGLATANLDTQLAALQSDTDNIQTRIPAALVAGRIDASVGAMASDTLTAAALATDAVTEIQSGLSTLNAAGVRSAVGLASANLDTQLAALQSDTDNIQTRIPAALVSGRIDASVGAMATDTLTAAAVAGDAVTEIQSGLSTLNAAGVRSAVGLASANLDTQLAALPTAAVTAAEVLKLDWSGITGEAARSLLNAARTLRNKVVISGGTITVYKEDGTTVAFTETATTDALAEPIIAVTPV